MVPQAIKGSGPAAPDVRTSALPAAALHDALVLPRPVARLDVLALVVVLLSAADPDFALDPGSLPVERERDDGEALPVRESRELVDLALVEEELSSGPDRRWCGCRLRQAG